MTAPLQDNWQLAGLILYADDDHYVKYDVVADNAPGQPPVRRVELRSEDGGPLTGPGGSRPGAAGERDRHLVAAPDQDRRHLHRRDQRRRRDLGADARLGDRRAGRPGDRPDGDRAGPGRRRSRSTSTTSGWCRTTSTRPRRSWRRSPTPPRARRRCACATRPTGSTPTAAGSTYEWEFEDGTALSRNVVRTYDEPGTYEATVTVTDEEGKTASDTVTVEVTPRVNDAPTVEAGADVDDRRRAAARAVRGDRRRPGRARGRPRVRVGLRRRGDRARPQRRAPLRGTGDVRRRR